MTAEPSFQLPDPQRIEPLIERYLGPGPRYTSYPTAPVWTEDFGSPQFEKALRDAAPRQLSVYVHVPYCESLCSYCACNREIRRDHSVAAPYLDSLEVEVARVADAIGGETAGSQLAVGGGTPTYLSPAELDRMCDIVDRHFPPAPGSERSIEVDPRVTTAEQLETLAGRGFNRISLGVQDLSPHVQQAIRRVQSREQTEETAETARRLGFRSVNFDLIYGLPHQTLESFGQTLEAVAEMRPDRIALYGYAHVTWVSKQQRGFERGDLPSAAEKVALLLLAIERLGAEGYAFLGLDHFALPDDDLFVAARNGQLHRNFMGYTTTAGEGLVGFGPSGISELASCYAQSKRSTAEWSDSLATGQLATLRGWQLSDDDLRRRWLIQRLMCQGEIDPAAYAQTWQEELDERVPDLAGRLTGFEKDGLLEAGASGWRLTPLGRIFARPVAMTFDAHLEGQADGRPRYSQTV
jgi:oxygen-independent coproporphyrinogen-3 oxidase